MAIKRKVLLYIVTDVITGEVILQHKNRSEVAEVLGIHVKSVSKYAIQGSLCKGRYSIETTGKQEVEDKRIPRDLEEKLNDVLGAAQAIREEKARRKMVKINGKWVPRTVFYDL